MGRKKRIEGGSKRARGGERKSEQAARVVATAAHQRLDTISINPASGLDCKQSWIRTPNVKRCATAAAAAAVAYQTVVPGEAVVVFLTCAAPPISYVRHRSQSNADSTGLGGGRGSSRCGCAIEHLLHQHLLAIHRLRRGPNLLRVGPIEIHCLCAP